MKTFLRDILITIIIAAAIFFGLRITIQSSVVVSPSMEPNFHVGQRLIINKVVYKFGEPRRGDVIVFRSPEDPQGDYIKRIIGLPGEVVEIKEGTVYVHKTDGSTLPLEEPYIAQPAERDFTSEEIPENEYLVLGDNRNNSSDSRHGWTLPREAIIGKAWLSVWPLGEWGFAANYSYQEE